MSIISNEEIGKRIRGFRLQAGLTQEKLAEELGITFQQVQKYESGATKVNLVRLQQIAEALRIPVSAFFEDAAHSPLQHSETEMQLLNAFRKIKEVSLRDGIVEIVTRLSQKGK